MIKTLYTALTCIAAPCMKPYLNSRVKKGKEDSSRLSERFGKTTIERPTGKLLWMHAASVGESLSALPLIEKIKQEKPDFTILITTGTITSATLLKTRLPERVIHQVTPLDIPKYIDNFLGHWQPDIALWMESELWPNTLDALKSRHIPAMLVNGRLSNKSYRNWQFAPSFIKGILSSFDNVLAQNSDMAENFKRLGATNTKYVGNLKFASPPSTYDEQELTSLQTAIGDRPLWLASSTHDGEESIIVETHKRLTEDHPDLLTIIAPRYTKEAINTISLAQENDLTIAQRSKNETITPQTSLYLADTMGEMGLFYKLSEIVTMFGSFLPKKWGGHNIIEPAHLECAITYGPIMYNHRDSKQALEDAGATIGVETPQDLYETIDTLLKNPAKVKTMQQNAKKTVTTYLNSVDTIADEIFQLIESKVSK